MKFGRFSPASPARLAVLLWLLVTSALQAQETAPALEKATFGMGCFWCAETAFEGLPGVVSVTSGYAGGSKKDPKYEEVAAGKTGHAECVQVVFDPQKIGYNDLLDIFWHNVDPTQARGQFCDHGDQYRSVILYDGDVQKRLAEDSKRKIETTPQRFEGKIVTGIEPASMFYPAEDYHQDFYKKDPERYESYRRGCGRDRRLQELWGAPGRHGRS